LLEPAHAVTDDALARLGRRGLGLRRHEGFGDLAPPPDLRPGALARQEESQRRQQLMYSIAPLRGAGVTRPELWQPLVEGLATHAAGDESATAFLRGMAKDLDEHSQGALMICLGMAPSDAAYVARELSKL
jgi:hypothetical protein